MQADTFATGISLARSPMLGPKMPRGIRFAGVASYDPLVAPLDRSLKF